MEAALIALAVALGPHLAGSGDSPLDAKLHARVRTVAPRSLANHRLPERHDLTGDWQLYPEAWRSRADFDGDGIEDTAVLLVRRKGLGFQLLVLLGTGTPVVLEERDWPAQGFGLGVASPGRYKTAAGKGYSVEAPNDPDEIVLALPGIDRYHFESWNAFWYWDPRQKRFKYIQMSD